MSVRHATLPLLVVAGLLTACTNSTVSSRSDQDAEPTVATDAEKLAYGVGYYLGEEVREGFEVDGVEFDANLVAEGFAAGLHDNVPHASRDELDEVLEAVHQEMERRMVARMLETDPNFKRLHDENLRRSQEFHRTFGAEPGVVTLPDGVQYKVLAEGSGPSPGLNDLVAFSYRGELADGTVFEPGKRAQKVVEDMLPGAQSFVRLMKPGSRWKVAVPPDRAFGGAGEPPAIGPNETLIAEFELVSIIGPEPEEG